MDNRAIYFDHAATTAIKPEVLEEMLPFFTSLYGNPSSIYAIGRESKKAIDSAREKTAKALNASFEEVFFTGSGTEADNWAITGSAKANEKKGKHLITSSIEHHAVIHTFQSLEKEGFEVTYLPVDNNGIVNIDFLKDSLREDTTLVSIMTANNEIGTIQPVKEIAEILKDRGIIFHTDAVQAIGSIPVDVKELGIDLLSVSAHKFYGPKGVGALYIKKGTKIKSIMYGGAQERGRRASTENVPGIVGLGKAIEIAVANIDIYSSKLLSLRDRAINEIYQKIPHIQLNGHREKRLPGNVNFSFKYIEGESLLLMLDLKGIASSSGSACSSGSLDPSHVLLAIGLPHEIAHGSLRLSFGEENNNDELDYFMEVLPKIVERLREMSPLYDEELK